MCNGDTVSDLAERPASDFEVGAEIPLFRLKKRLSKTDILAPAIDRQGKGRTIKAFYRSLSLYHSHAIKC